MSYVKIHRSSWNEALRRMLNLYNVYASVLNEHGQDYELLNEDLIDNISYNTPKPTTPLKNFFLPIKENVSDFTPIKSRVIIGVPNCDLEGLRILDEIYLDEKFIDKFYKDKRDNTVIISSDCFSTQEHCHCTTYGVKPYVENNGDLSVSLIDENVIISIFSSKGERLIKELEISQFDNELDTSVKSIVDRKRNEVLDQLAKLNKQLPDYKKTGELVANSKEDIWKKYSSTCVSCGACTTICPTCSCFLLIDKPNFDKVKQVDACQYPGFERVAGGEDALQNLYVRFRNRYLCKYVWKPKSFKSIACTGCGRCIEACIGKINKNELFMELTT